MYNPKYKIIQPKGYNYMIQKAFYQEEHAQAYIDMLVNKMEKYIERKSRGERVAPLMTIDSMNHQLSIMKQFKIEAIH